MEFRELLLSLVLVWLAAKAAGEGMERIGQTAVLGELLAGVIIGPGVLGLVHESEALHALAELGVLILLFEVGLESDLHDLAILRVIGSSPTNTQPVFETTARSGLSVCAALGCVVFVVDGDMLRMAATEGVRPERLERVRRDYPIPLSAEIDTARTVRDRRIVHLADIAHNPSATASDVEHARLAGYRTRLMVPMVR